MPPYSSNLRTLRRVTRPAEKAAHRDRDPAWLVIMSTLSRMRSVGAPMIEMVSTPSPATQPSPRSQPLLPQWLRPRLLLRRRRWRGSARAARARRCGGCVWRLPGGRATRRGRRAVTRHEARRAQDAGRGCDHWGDCYHVGRRGGVVSAVAGARGRVPCEPHVKYCVSSGACQRGARPMRAFFPQTCCMWQWVPRGVTFTLEWRQWRPSRRPAPDCGFGTLCATAATDPPPSLPV